MVFPGRRRSTLRRVIMVFPRRGRRLCAELSWSSRGRGIILRRVIMVFPEEVITLRRVLLPSSLARYTPSLLLLPGTPPWVHPVHTRHSSVHTRCQCSDWVWDDETLGSNPGLGLGGKEKGETLRRGIRSHREGETGRRASTTENG